MLWNLIEPILPWKSKTVFLNGWSGCHGVKTLNQWLVRYGPLKKNMELLAGVVQNTADLQSTDYRCSARSEVIRII